jgi:hypothetical protein
VKRTVRPAGIIYPESYPLADAERLKLHAGKRPRASDAQGEASPHHHLASALDLFHLHCQLRISSHLLALA